LYGGLLARHDIAVKPGAVFPARIWIQGRRHLATELRQVQKNLAQIWVYCFSCQLLIILCPRLP
jgi:hypothetical protein